MAVNFNDVETLELQKQYNNHRKSYDDHDKDEIKGHGYNNANDGLLLKTATISSPEISPENGYDPLDANLHMNVSIGKCNISWEDEPGGDIGDPSNSLGNKSFMDVPVEDLPEMRTSAGQACNSGRERVNLTSPYIWTSKANWSGIGFVPPVGSRVIVGKGKQYASMILNYVPAHWTSIKPLLMPGETCIKGFGNNYIHFRQSDKLDICAKTSAGTEDTETGSSSESDCTCWMRLNANEGNITISVGSGDGSSSIFITGDEITIQTGTLNMQARDLIKMNAPMITQN